MSVKSKTNLAESKPPTCKKLKIFEVRSLASGSSGERFEDGANSKKFGYYVGEYKKHKNSLINNKQNNCKSELNFLRNN